jgi:DNA gyrase subunit B
MEFTNNDEYHDTHNGIKVKPMAEIGIIDHQHDDKITGTKIEFYPDYTIMEKASFDHSIIANRLKQLAYLNKNLKMIFIDEILETKDE